MPSPGIIAAYRRRRSVPAARERRCRKATMVRDYLFLRQTPGREVFGFSVVRETSDCALGSTANRISGLNLPFSTMQSRQTDAVVWRVPLRANLSCPPRPEGMTAPCAKPPFVMARQTSIHHRSDQTRNRHGWRGPAERKLRLGFKQYGERYLWFESISLHQKVPASGDGFPPREIRRRYKALVLPGPVCGSHLAGLSASSRRMRLRVSMPQNSVSQMPVGLSDGDAGHAATRWAKRAGIRSAWP